MSELIQKMNAITKGNVSDPMIVNMDDWNGVIDEVRQVLEQLEQAEARLAEMEAEALYLRARDDALVDFLCNESGVDIVSVKAACGHIPSEDAWLLRKQAEAVEQAVRGMAG